MCFEREIWECDYGWILMFIITNCKFIHVFFPHLQLLLLVILYAASYVWTLVKINWLTSTHWASFKWQIKGRFFQNGTLVSKECFLKTGKTIQEKQPSVLLFFFIRELGHRLPLNWIIFICQKRRFVISRKASFYQHSGLKLPNNPSRAFQRALPCIKGLPCLVFKFACIIWPFISLE